MRMIVVASCHRLEGQYVVTFALYTGTYVFFVTLQAQGLRWSWMQEPQTSVSIVLSPVGLGMTVGIGMNGVLHPVSTMIRWQCLHFDPALIWIPSRVLRHQWESHKGVLAGWVESDLHSIWRACLTTRSGRWLLHHYGWLSWQVSNAIDIHQT